MGKKQNNKSFFKGFACGVGIVIIAFAGYLGVTRIFGNPFGGGQMPVEQKIKGLEQMIDSEYLYGDKIDKSKMEEGMLKGYIEELGDPYSVYYDKEEFKELQDSVEGSFYGIGVQFVQNMETRIMTVTRVFEGSPAEDAGIKEGDILSKVNGKRVEGKLSEEVVKNIKGKEKTTVELTFIRDDEEYTTTATRKEIVVPTVEAKMQQDKIGCITITEFTGDTWAQFEAALKDLEKDGLKGLVIDLRNNPGGRVDTTCQILDRLLPEGTLVYTENKKGQREINEKSDEKNKFDKPIAVVVNKNSASASEIFAGAIQDFGAGKVIGEQTFGKGIVQQIYSLKDGSGLKLTVSEYFTPKGRSLHKKGVTPDIKASDEASLERAVEIIKREIK